MNLILCEKKLYFNYFFQARKEIVLRSQNKFIYCRKCDLASQESIKEFVDQFKKGKHIILLHKLACENSSSFDFEVIIDSSYLLKYLNDQRKLYFSNHIDQNNIP